MCTHTGTRTHMCTPPTHTCTNSFLFTHQGGKTLASKTIPRNAYIGDSAASKALHFGDGIMLELTFTADKWFLHQLGFWDQKTMGMLGIKLQAIRKEGARAPITHTSTPSFRPLRTSTVSLSVCGMAFPSLVSATRGGELV